MAPHLLSPPIDNLSCRLFSCFSLSWSSAIVLPRLPGLETVTAVLHGTRMTSRHARALLRKDVPMSLLVPSARVARWCSCASVLGVRWDLVPLLEDSFVVYRLDRVRLYTMRHRGVRWED